MSTNIIEIIQSDLDYPALRKIDPNIQEPKNKNEQSRVEKIAQGAIPAVMAGLYSLSRKDDGSARISIMQTNPNAGLLEQIFDGGAEEAVKKVAQYAEANESDVKDHMEIISAEAIRVIRKEAGENADALKVKHFLNDQRHNILSYLPAAMNFGGLLHDETMDDRTNKMEGPISNFIHKIEDKFSGSGG